MDTIVPDASLLTLLFRYVPRTITEEDLELLNKSGIMLTPLREDEFLADMGEGRSKKFRVIRREAVERLVCLSQKAKTLNDAYLTGTAVFSDVLKTNKEFFEMMKEVIGS